MKVCPLCGEPADTQFCGLDGTRLVENSEAPADDPLIGTVVAGKYTILRPLGQGGMGQVYVANQELVDRPVALKVLRPELLTDPSVGARFLQEARAGSRLSHPHVVVIHDFGYTDAPMAYLVMELLPGIGLDAILAAEGRLPWRKAIHLAKQVLSALGAAHALGVVHRDVKPGNVLVDRRGGADFVKVLDFGLAKLRDTTGEKLTQRGQFLGTPEFMAPEQVQGQEVTAATDLYALGILLYEMLVGEVPFQGVSPTATILKQLQATARAPSKVVPEAGIPGALDEVVARCLQKDPSRRFASADEVLAVLEAVDREADAAGSGGIKGAIGAPPEPAITRHELDIEVAAAVAADRHRRRRLNWLVFLLGLLMLVSGLQLWVIWEPSKLPGEGAVPEGRAFPAASGTPADESPPNPELEPPRGYRLDRLPFGD
jgi:serine/threonine-protein kinase